MGRYTIRGAQGGRLALLPTFVFLLSLLSAGVMPAPKAQANSTDEIPDLDQIEQQFQKLARRVSPAVVAISGADEHSNDEAAQRSEELNPERLSKLLDATDRTVGTGLIIDASGYILTNDHVIAHSEQLWITTDDKKVYPAIVVGSDPRADLALLKIPATNLPAVRFAAPGRVRRGQWAVAIGNPFGLSATGEMCMSVGIVSAMGRSLPKLSGKEDRLYSDLLQTTAQINPGNSGGPLFDVNGAVIGINTAVILPQKQTNGIGFAIPVTPRLLKTIATLKQGREIEYGFIGASVYTPTSRQRRELNIDGEIGAAIDRVEENTPAAQAGLKEGDVVLKVAGQTIDDGDHFVREIGTSPVGEAIELRLVRQKKVITQAVTLRQREMPVPAITRASQRLRWRGMLLGPVPANWAAEKDARPGLMVIGIDPTSPAVKEGVIAGSVITSVARHAVSDVLELQRIINDTPPEECAMEIAHSPAIVASSSSGD